MNQNFGEKATSSVAPTAKPACPFARAKRRKKKKSVAVLARIPKSWKGTVSDSPTASPKWTSPIWTSFHNKWCGFAL
jgi:hypothetical protein